MKKLLATLTGVLTIGAAIPAIAGPDWQLIEQARKGNAVKMQREAAQQPQLAAAARDTSMRIVLPLDHGPRAQTTPWSNQQRLLRAEREARAKAEAKSASMPESAE